jgi:hypothetical protein
VRLARQRNSTDSGQNFGIQCLSDSYWDYAKSQNRADSTTH